MVAVLPAEILQKIAQSQPCRDSQIRDLGIYYNGQFPAPPILVAYGLDQKSKLNIICSILQTRSLKYGIVRSIDCLSQRHLLSKIFSTAFEIFEDGEHVEQYDRIDSINALEVNLQRLMGKTAEQLILVLDGIDKQRGAGHTLLPALARLNSVVPHLFVIMTSSSPRPLHLHRAGVPSVYFGPYSRAEAIYLISRSPPALAPPELSDGKTKYENDALLKIYNQFVITVYDSLVVSTSSTSLSTFRDLCQKLWPKFIWPAFSEETPIGQSKIWDFARLMVRNRGLFQVDGENALVDRIQPQQGLWSLRDRQNPTSNTILQSTSQPRRLSQVSINQPHNTENTKAARTRSNNPPLLKHFSTLVLVSAYLASHTHQKHDIVLFSRLSSSSSKKVRKSLQKKKSMQSPSKMAAASENSQTTTKSMRSLFDSKLGLARPFGIERLVAILRSIHPEGVSNRKGVSDRVYRELGELERLRLVVRSGGIAGEDSEEKWKINVNRDWVVGMGRIWGMGVSDYEMEQDL